MKTKTFIAIEYEKAVFLPECSLWLDPSRARPFAFVSHAHADHFARHQRILCSSGTFRLIESRYGSRKSESGDVVLEFGESHEENGFRFTVVPAGHIAGSAQILVEELDTGSSLVYTGDFKTRESLAAEKIEIQSADILIMETTYGIPRYCLPPTEEILSRLALFVQRTLDEGAIPVLQGYSLGKAQELIAAVHQRIPQARFQVHSAVEEMNKTARELGFPIPECELFDPKKRSPEGRVLIIPPNAKSARNLNNTRTAIATGWALGSGARYRYRASEIFPLSDHAGYDDLLDFVENVDPKVVYTLHGFAREFAADLRNLGREAWSLIGQNQMELDLGVTPILGTKNSGENPVPSNGELAELTRVCEKIERAAEKDRKRKVLVKYLKGLAPDELESVCLHLSGRCFSESNKRRGVSWHLTKRALQKAARLSEAEFRAVESSQTDHREIASIVLRGKGKDKPASISEVRDFFCQLTACGEPGATVNLLSEWFRDRHHSESAFLVSLLSGELRIGLKEELFEEAIAEAFSCDIEKVRWMRCHGAYLGEIARLAKEERFDDWNFDPFRPLILLDPDGGDSVEKGKRLQFHKSGTRFEWYDQDYQLLTKIHSDLNAAASGMGDDVILVGMISSGVEGDLFLGGEIPASFGVMDILWKNGELLTDVSFRKRRKELEALALPDCFRILEI